MNPKDRIGKLVKDVGLEAGDVIKMPKKGNIFLIGHLNLLSGYCDDCMEDTKEAVIIDNIWKGSKNYES